MQHNEQMQYISMPSQLLMHRRCYDLSDPGERQGKAALDSESLFSLTDFLFSPEHHSYQAACVQLQHLGCDFLAAAQNLCYQIPPATLMSAPTDLCLLANVSKLHSQAQHIVLQSHLRQKTLTQGLLLTSVGCRRERREDRPLDYRQKYSFRSQFALHSFQH